MALIFADGFDHYVIADGLKKWTSTTNMTFPNELDMRPEWARPPGGMGLRMTNSGNRTYRKTLPSTYATLVTGFNVYFESAGGSVGFFGLGDSGSEQVSLRHNASNNLLLSRNGTTLATSTNTFSNNTWYHIEMKVTINNSTGAYEVRVNGSSTGWIAAATSQNTRATSNNFANEIFVWANDGLLRFDDMYVLDTTGSVSNDFVGPQKIITIYPNAAGNYSQWTGNYASNFANVNETAGDGDGTFNQSSTAGQKDTFAFDDVPTGTIAGIQHTLMVRQDAGAQRSVRPIQRSSGTDYNGTTVNTSGSHQFITDPKTTNPATSSAYTTSEVNGAEFGYELVS